MDRDWAVVLVPLGLVLLLIFLGTATTALMMGTGL